MLLSSSCEGTRVAPKVFSWESLFYQMRGVFSFSRVSVSEIRSGRNDGAIRREPAAKECYLSPGQTSSAVSLWPKPDVSGCRCNIVGTRPAHAADAARQTRSHDRGTRVGSSRSVVQHSRSATAIAALSLRMRDIGVTLNSGRGVPTRSPPFFTSRYRRCDRRPHLRGSQT
jgi:hypothetical protein